MEITGKRKQILNLVEEGKHTKQEIADALEMKMAGVSSQFTYLRWGGYNVAIVDGVCQLLSDEDYAAMKSKKKSKAKAVSKLPFVERVRRAFQAKARAEKRIETLKAQELAEGLEDVFVEEHAAKVTIEEAKVRRNEITLEAFESEDPDLFEQGEANFNDPNYEYVADAPVEAENDVSVEDSDEDSLI